MEWSPLRLRLADAQGAAAHGARRVGVWGAIHLRRPRAAARRRDDGGRGCSARGERDLGAASDSGGRDNPSSTKELTTTLTPTAVSSSGNLARSLSYELCT